MTNGFYDYSIFKTDKELRDFFEKAIELAFYCEVEWIPSSLRREICKEYSVKEFLQNDISLNYHISIVDRYVYNKQAFWADKIGEVVIGNLSDKDRKMLWIKLDLDKFKELIEYFSLELKEF